ncbi:YebC/PmpR family DNA-binding transcriptional regulator [Patescibacteria group bacterium]|nr:YebC/PmpR family DNA-binding transcriptional regulator [Patescibacteria group bacterium]
MSGHSKWSTIKRQKGVTDARRGAAFTKAANAVTVAAKDGGGDPETNFKLRLVIDAAKQVNMPKENIERAIKRATGEGREGQKLEEIVYEGFGPAGVGIMVEVVTDNKQRTAQEVRSTFERNGGRLSGPGSVSYLFNPIGEIVVRFGDDVGTDQMMLTAAESGAEDVETDKEQATIYCRVEDLEKVKNNLNKHGLEVIETRISRRPSSVVKIVDDKQASSILSLVNKLDDLADAQRVYANFDLPEEILQKEAV